MARPTKGYKNADGKRVVGVTTITGRFEDKGGLMWWAFEQGKAAERGEIDSLYDKRDEAASIGTLAHEMVEADINNEPFNADEYAPELIAKASRAFEAYKSWASASSLEVIAQEMPLVSEKYQYGGTPDAIGMVDGELCIVDWKTSKGIYPGMLCQVSAYKQLWEENNPQDPITGGFHICRFDKETGDFAHHYYSELDDAWEMFKICRQAYELDKVLKKRV